MKLDELAQRLGCKLIGDGSLEVEGVAGIETATAKEVTFLTNPRYASLVAATGAGAIIVGKELEGSKLAQLISSNPYLDFARALEIFYQGPAVAAGVHPTAVVADSAQIGAGASIGRNVFQHRDPTRMVAAICAIVHENKNVEEALKILK